MYALASYVVYATTSGVPTAVQGGVYAIGAGGYGGFFPNMGGSITYGSIHHLLRHRHSVGLKDSTVVDLSIFIS